jgi:hypothetical protein
VGKEAIMYSLVETPYEDERLKTELEAIAQAQRQAKEIGGFLVTEFDKLFLPSVTKLEGVTRGSYSSHTDTGLVFNWACEFGEIKALPGGPHGTAIIVPSPGASLPQPLLDEKEWKLGEAVLDYSTRTVMIKDGDALITFPSVEVGLDGRKLLAEINDMLLAQNAGLLVWKLSGVISDPNIEHLYPNGDVPRVRNEHAQADVTGYATTNSNWNATLVYAGVVAHKTAIESLHATLLQRKSLSLDGYPCEPDNHFRLEVMPLPDFNLFHGALISDAALPGRWNPQDEKAYALVSKRPGLKEEKLNTLLEAAVMVRLKEVLPHAVKDEWAHELFTRAMQKGLIDRLRTGGDCLAGVRIHIDKDWTATLNDLLETQDLIV